MEMQLTAKPTFTSYFQAVSCPSAYTHAMMLLEVGRQTEKEKSLKTFCVC